MNKNDDAGLIGFIVGLPIFLILVFWLVIALVASWVAPEDRRLTFFITLFFLGPLGIAAAAVAQPRPSRTRVLPPSTRELPQSIEDDDEDEDEDAEWISTTPEPPARSLRRVRCFDCGHIQVEPAGAERFQCDECGRKLRLRPRN